MLLRVEGRRTVRRALDALRLRGDEAACRLQLDPLASDGRLRGSVVRAQRRDPGVLHLGIAFDRRATPTDCLRRWARFLAELSTPQPSTTSNRYETQRLSAEELPPHTPSSDTGRSTRRLPASSARASAASRRESARLVSSRGAATAILPTPTPVPARPSARLEPLPSGDPFVGHVIGPCLVQERVGEGTFGRVYRALHLRLQQPVALKLLARATVKGNELSRFELEAKAAACLSDPHVAKVFELGQDEEGRPFIVQEFVEGESLHARVERMGPLALDEAIKLGAGISSGLLSIHRASMVHRDLKPENVMITEDDEPKIVDFGLVRRIGDEAEFTPEGLLLGTPAFLAPEQIERREAGHAREADLYALGCVLFYALTGRVPHMEQDPSGETLTVFLYRRMSTDAPDVRALRAGVPEPLARLIGSLLSSSPSHRCTAAQAQMILSELAGQFEVDEEEKLVKGSSARRRASSSRLRRKSGSSRARQRALGSRRVASARLAKRGGSSTRLEPHTTTSRRLRRVNGVGSGRNRPAGAPTGPAVVASVALAAILILSFVVLLARGDEPQRSGRATPAATAPAQATASERSAESAERQAKERLLACDPSERPGEALRLARGVLRAYPQGEVARQALRLRRDATRALQTDCDRALSEASSLVQRGRWADSLELLRETVVRHGEEAPTTPRLLQRLRDTRERLLEALEAELVRVEAALLDGEHSKAGTLLASAVQAYGREQVDAQLNARLAASGVVRDQRVHEALKQLSRTASKSE